MSKWDKLLAKVLSGRSDHNICFDDLAQLLVRLGFEKRIDGSHHMFSKDDFPLVNLQPIGRDAKAYQVKQVRRVLQTSLNET